MAAAATTYDERRAWSAAASGERQVGWILERLSRPRWHVFHDVPVGSRGANIDHVLIGPGGVFSLNDKNLRGRVWVGSRCFAVNGYHTDYLPKAHAEGQRVMRALGVTVRPLIVVLCPAMRVVEQPADVTVLEHTNLFEWLSETRSVTSATEVGDIAPQGRQPCDLDGVTALVPRAAARPCRSTLRSTT
jgi:hypothetical protein